MTKNIILSMFFLFLFSCKKEGIEFKTISEVKENEVYLTDAQLKNASISIGKLGNQSVATTLDLNGKIDVPPQNLVSVSVPLGGYLANSHLLPGMHVNKGEVIAVMQDQQYIQLQQDYLVSSAKLNFAEKEYNRQKELNQSQASSDKVMQMAQSELASIKAVTSGLAEKLRLININPNKVSASNISQKINIYASISGYVSKVNVNIGKYISPSEVLFELINPTDIHLNIKVYEKDVAKLKIGQKIMAFTNAKPNDKHLCEIILISKSIDLDGSSEVHCHFQDYDKTLLPGMYMNAQIELQSTNATVLPEEAVVSFEEKEYVFVQLNKNSFRLQEVVIGEQNNNYVQIKNQEFLRNQNIVLKGAYTLLMKMKNTEEEE